MHRLRFPVRFVYQLEKINLKALPSDRANFVKPDYPISLESCLILTSNLLSMALKALMGYGLLIEIQKDNYQAHVSVRWPLLDQLQAKPDWLKPQLTIERIDYRLFKQALHAVKSLVSPSNRFAFIQQQHEKLLPNRVPTVIYLR